MEEVIVKQVKSQIGARDTHKKTLVALGLRRIGHSRKHKLTPEVKGMIDSVKHLIQVEKA